MDGLSASDLLGTVKRQCPPPARAWLDAAIAGLEPPLDRNRFAAAYAGARRRLGDAALAAGAAHPLCGWWLHAAFRAGLLLRAVECLEPRDHAQFIDEIYLRGDNAEREALLHTLCHLPDPARFRATAVEACRSNVQSIFAAIACENPYPVRYFDDRELRQMVLKALFTGAAVTRIVGLKGRITPELVRMAEDYASERRAAGRSIPEEIAFITGSQR